MRAPVFAANWKMNLGPREAAAYMERFLAEGGSRRGHTVAFFPPALSLAAVKEALGEHSDVLLGVQNIHWEDKGAFTGELSARMAADAGAALCLVGHSERRHVFGERDEECGRKCVAAVRAGLVPVLCVGETLDERESGQTRDIVLRQLRAGIGGLTADDVANLVVAYEPVWAIGTGRTATPGDASAVHVVIRDELARTGGERARGVPIVYGGSVNAANAEALLAEPEVGGLLVGGASLDPVTWSAILRA
ncbi:MAG: triose-phosphate isomerase [Gemmatimonadaceae bacterium]